MTNHPVKLSCFTILPDRSGMVRNKWSLIAMDASVNGYFHFKLKSRVHLNGKTAACWTSAKKKPKKPDRERWTLIQ